MDKYEELKQKVRRFNEDRDWDQFHSPDNLAKSVAIEAGELLECFQWNSDYDLEAVSDEMADVFVYLLDLADRLGVDLVEVSDRKMDKNALKYPVDKAKGKADKYNKL
ncbi:MAG: nucleotide pyrophosphohydrolase [Erysipelotrichaceae bacterium]|nr:nucleotide pyrophosphohydrolase [Erysipelotrichaceae bacterium]